MRFLLGPGGAGVGGDEGKAPFRWGKTQSHRESAVSSPLCAAPRPLRGVLPRSPLGSPAPRPRPRGPATAPGGRRPRAGGTESSVKTQRAGEKKHGAGKQYVQNPQGIAVNSFLFEENLQLGNRPFYDLFGLVIGCGWSCAGSERFHGLFLISLANFPLHSAFREPQPLFS